MIPLKVKEITVVFLIMCLTQTAFMFASAAQELKTGQPDVKLEDVKPGPGFVLPGRGKIPREFTRGRPGIEFISTERVVISGLTLSNLQDGMLAALSGEKSSYGPKTFRLTPSAGFRRWEPQGVTVVTWKHPSPSKGLEGEIAYFQIGAFLPGVEHVWISEYLGEEQLWNCNEDPCDDYLIKSDPKYPLTFKLTLDRHYTYLCGRGTIVNKDPKKGGYQFGMKDTVDVYLPFLHGNAIERQGATQALGSLARTKEDMDKAVPLLIGLLKDQEMEVRRDAAESLGRIGGQRAMEALVPLTDPQIEKDDWVRDVAKESLELIKAKG